MSRNTEDIRGKCWKVCIITTRLSSFHSLNATASYCTFSLTENIKVACWVNSGGKKCSSTLQHRRDFLRVQTVCTATCWCGLLILLHTVFFFFNPGSTMNTLSFALSYSVIHGFTLAPSLSIHRHSFTLSSSFIHSPLALQ